LIAVGSGIGRRLDLSRNAAESVFQRSEDGPASRAWWSAGTGRIDAEFSLTPLELSA
jgi:hypothetical protein